MFEVPQTVFDTYNAAVSAMIDSNFGIECTILYPPIKTNCTNCFVDNMTGRSTGIYNGTGPIPFNGMFCPYCNGAGGVSTTEQDIIKLRCYFTPKSWIKIHTDITVPDGSIQTIGHIEDVLKVRRANYLLVNTLVDDYGQYKYRLNGEVQFHGFQRNKFFIAMWARER
jgi:hypothetical protein